MSHLPPDTDPLTVYACPRDCAAAIAWYVEVLGAVEEGERYVGDDGRLGHAEVLFGDGPRSRLMLSDAHPDFAALAPEPGAAGTTFALQLYVPDADATVAAAEEAGAAVLRPVEEQFYGSRRGTILDPFGIRWMISTHVQGSAGS